MEEFCLIIVNAKKSSINLKSFDAVESEGRKYHLDPSSTGKQRERDNSRHSVLTALVQHDSPLQYYSL
jgi:hypothetical protein